MTPLFQAQNEAVHWLTQEYESEARLNELSKAANLTEDLKQKSHLVEAWRQEEKLYNRCRGRAQEWIDKVVVSLVD